MDRSMLAVDDGPLSLPGYTGVFAQNAPSMLDLKAWTPMLSSLYSQRCYLSNLLSKTAITLNALRERQTRNEKALSKNPTPRSKRKKIQQNRWRTSRTIQTCENEERVILDCLQVCNSNINALEAIVTPREPCSTVFDLTSSNSMIDSETTSFDWGGWTDETPISPFVRTRVRSLPMEEISPETPLNKTEFDIPPPRSTRHLPPHPPRARAEAVTLLPPPVPPNSAFSNSNLSPEAAAFNPDVTHLRPGNDDLTRQLDKLSISGLLASKRMVLIEQRRSSDMVVSHMFHELPDRRPSLGQLRGHRTWATTSPEQHKKEPERPMQEAGKRTNSF